MRCLSRQHGLTLIELLLASAVGALLLAGLNGLVKLGLDAQGAGRMGNELAYQARFALERIADAARATAPKPLAVPAANTTGDWFAPKMFCLNAGQQLIETMTWDTGCSGTAVIAAKVTALSATLPADMGPIDRHVAVIGLSLASGGSTFALSASLRLGGGTQ